MAFCDLNTAEAGTLTSADLPSDEESDDGSYDPEAESSDGAERSDDNRLVDVLPEQGDSDSD